MLSQLPVLSIASRAARYSSRRFATAAGGSYMAEMRAIQEHAKQTSDLWRKISLYVCIPATLVCVAWVRNVEGEHAQHLEHVKEENDGILPDPPAYDYMNKRVKPFPWGNNSLFFNPHSNKNMEVDGE